MKYKLLSLILLMPCITNAMNQEDKNTNKELFNNAAIKYIKSNHSLKT